MDLIRALSTIVGLLVILTAFYWSARIMMVKGTDPPFVARFIFRGCRNFLHFAGDLMSNPEKRRELWTLYIPVSLISVLAWSLALATLGFMLLLYGVTENSMRTAYANSISSMSTLGIAGEPKTLLESTIGGIEAFTGPVFVALLIAYTVNIYSAYNDYRGKIEALDEQLEHFGNGPDILVRAAQGPGIDALEPLWSTLSDEFNDLSRRYRTVEGYLLFFAPNMSEHWSIDAPALLDAAALRNSLVAGEPSDIAAQTIQDGEIALKHLARHYRHRVLTLRKPAPFAEVDHALFEWLAAGLNAAGVEVAQDLDQAWKEFEALRADYAPKVAQLRRMLPAVDPVEANKDASS